MSETDREDHHKCVNRFIALANSMKDEGLSPDLVSAGLMTASGLYTTYVVTGNAGGLTESGVEKVTEKYKQELSRLQELKRKAAGA